MCLVGPDGTPEEGHFCTLAPKHVCLQTNATVTGLLSGKGESLVRSIGDLVAAMTKDSPLKWPSSSVPSGREVSACQEAW